MSYSVHEELLEPGADADAELGADELDVPEMRAPRLHVNDEDLVIADGAI